MSEICMGYTLQLPNLNQIIDATIKDTLNIFTSILELGKKYKESHDRNIFRVFINRIEEILPKKTKDAIIKDILTKLPERQWLISDYDKIMKIFLERIADKEVKDMETLIRNTFTSEDQIKKFILLFFNEIVVRSKKNQEYWRDLILNEEDPERMHIYNEISLSLKEMSEISYKHSKRFNKRSLEMMRYMILHSLRISRILLLLQSNKGDLALRNSKYLRSERFDMKHNA